MPFDLPSYSRFRDTDHILYNDSHTFGLWNEPDVLKSIDDRDIINYDVDAGYSGRPDLIANEFYGSSFYDWIIIMFNKPLNPIGWPHHGDTIRVPSKDSVVDVL